MKYCTREISDYIDVVINESGKKVCAKFLGNLSCMCNNNIINDNNDRRESVFLVCKFFLYMMLIYNFFMCAYIQYNIVLYFNTTKSNSEIFSFFTL